LLNDTEGVLSSAIAIDCRAAVNPRGFGGAAGGTLAIALDILKY
jgi:hypothetical protein